MGKKGRVLYHGKDGELYLETDNVDELLVFIASNKAGFSGYTLLDLENHAKQMTAAARGLSNILDELKDIVYNKSPAMLGYSDFTSKKERKEIEDRKTEDSVLRDLKAYTEEIDAI